MVDISADRCVAGRGINTRGCKIDTQDSDVWKNRPYAEIGDKIGESVWPFLVDIWDGEKNNVHIRIGNLWPTNIEWILPKHLIDDEKFDTVGYVLNEWNKVRNRRR